MNTAYEWYSEFKDDCYYYGGSATNPFAVTLTDQGATIEELVDLILNDYIHLQITKEGDGILYIRLKGNTIYIPYRFGTRAIYQIYRK